MGARKKRAGGEGTSRPAPAEHARKRFDPSQLDRTVIAIPLVERMARMEGERAAGEAPPVHPVVIDLNLDFAGGREAARQFVIGLVAEVVVGRPSRTNRAQRDTLLRRLDRPRSGRSGECLPVVRSEAELADAHPVLAAYRQQEESVSFSSDACVRTVRPAYQGLITQLDDHLGRLFDAMSRSGLMDNTLIIFTADHGDFLGDHWFGEKELFYDAVQRVPFIMYDPSPEADTTRGTVDDRMIESVDVLPTMLSWLGLPQASHRIEGRDLLPLLRGEHGPWRDCVFSELDYSYRLARVLRGKSPANARAWSVRTDRWRYVYWLDEPEQLYDLENDPQQFTDLGRSPAHADVRAECRGRLLQWFMSLKRRTTVTDAEVERGTNAYKKAGVFFGQW
jgi:arylsulfatase A-like enzyme